MDGDPRPSLVIEREKGLEAFWSSFKNRRLTTDTWRGGREAAGVGSSLGVSPDLDGDCIEELLVAAKGVARDFLIAVPDPKNASGNLTIPRGLVWAIEPATGRVLRAWHGTGPFDRFGACMLAIDDIDGDGVCDLVISSPGAHEGRGRIECFSGRDGLRLRVYDGLEPGAEFGASLALLEDIDGDGLRDLAAGAPLGRGLEDRAGCVLVVSSRDGKLLANLPGPQAGCRFGHALDAAVDLSGDGVCDLVIGAPAFTPGIDEVGAGLVMVISPIDGFVIGVIEGRWSSQALGRAVAGMPSFDAGPWNQIAVASGGFGKDDRSRGMFQCFRAPDFPLTHDRDEPPSCGCEDTQFGASMAVLDDLDGDGHDDVAIGAPGHEDCDDPHGLACVFYSPGGSKERRRHRSNFRDCEWVRPGGFGASIVRLPDLDADGTDEYAIGAADEFLSSRGGLQVFCGSSGWPLLQVLGQQLTLP